MYSWCKGPVKNLCQHREGISTAKLKRSAFITTWTIQPVLNLAWKHSDNLPYIDVLPSASILERLMHLLLSDNAPLLHALYTNRESF
jgi:hypothetical protein